MNGNVHSSYEWVTPPAIIFASQSRLLRIMPNIVAAASDNATFLLAGQFF
jgi:hypothetical protein